MLNSIVDQVFSFENTALPVVVEARVPAPDVNLPEVMLALSAAGESAYHWSIATDEITWSSHAATILDCALDRVRDGKHFASMLDTQNLTSRFETVMRTQTRDSGEGVDFRIEYQFCCDGRDGDKSVWIEDHGRWFAGTDGRPCDVYGTIRRVDSRHDHEERLNFLGNCDPLTGMMNRGRMTEALGEAISVAAREHGQCAFAIAAVNNLPVVNEAYGFEVADEVIVALGRRLRQVMRGGDGIARFSGGKFGIILNNCDEQELHAALERFLVVVRDNVIETQHGPVWAMLSIGALCLPEHAGDANRATARAEEALNEARRHPSDTYVIYKPSARLAEERQLNARCATEIVHCLKTDRFKMAFQPLITAATGEIAMHEALLRMSDRDGGELIEAGHLIPVAERLGLVRLIDRGVTQMIIDTLHSYPDSKLTMNVSATTATDPRWYTQILDMIRTTGSVAQRLTVEITETTVMNDIATTRKFVESLRDAGCGVAIDDFGAGYTSFRNLRELPINMIKLDGSFCQNLKGNSENEYIVRSLIDLGDKFNLKTVAEWIETEDDAELLTSWGIDYLQGHYFGHASVVPPWAPGNLSTFVIAPVEVVDTADTSEIPASEVPPGVPEGDLDFSGIDDSISALKSTLELLRNHFPESPDISEQAA